MSSIVSHCAPPRYHQYQQPKMSPVRTSVIYEAEKKASDLRNKAKETGEVKDYAKAVGYDLLVKPLSYPPDYYMKPKVIY